MVTGKENISCKEWKTAGMDFRAMDFWWLSTHQIQDKL